MFRCRTRFNRRIAIALIAFHVAGLASSAAPLGGTVVSGQADITAASGITQIRQQTDRAVINWQSFSSQAGEAVRFQQPSATSVTLNRVVTLDPSVLNGSLTANGRLFLINPNGIVFGPTSQVNVGSLVASTLSISDHDFQRGNYRLVQAPDRPLASIINQGKITAAPGGMVALVAPVVNNQGEIVAAAGRVVLAGGAAARVDLDAGLVSLDVPAAPPRDVVVGTDGAANPLAEAVNNRALVEAGSVTEQGGKVVLGSAEGLVVNTGRISVDGPSGGRVKLDSTQATVHAGRGVISANATAAGAAGGEIKVLGQKTTAFGRSARIEARGGEGGQGGFAEVSGASIILQGRVDVSAAGGTPGSFLIDPEELSIVDAGGSLDPVLAVPPCATVAQLDLGVTSGGVDTLSVAILNQVALSGDIALEVGSRLIFKNTDPIEMQNNSFSIRFLGAGGCGVVEKTTPLSAGAITGARDVSIVAEFTSATLFDLSNLEIGATGTVTLHAGSIGAAPEVRIGAVGTSACTPARVEVRAPGGVVRDGDASSGTVNIRAISAFVEAGQIGQTGAGGDLDVDVQASLELAARDLLLVSSSQVPGAVSVALEHVKPGQVEVVLGSAGSSRVLRADAEGRLEVPQALDADLSLRGVNDLDLSNVALAANRTLTLTAADGAIRVRRDARLESDSLVIETRDGMFSGSASKPEQVSVDVQSVLVNLTGDGPVSLLDENSITVGGASALTGDIDIEARGDLFVASTAGAKTFGSAAGTLKLVSNGPGGKVRACAGDTLGGRQVILEAASLIEVAHLAATERVQFRIGDGGVLLADLDALPRELRVIQDVASGSDIAVQFGAQFVAGAVGNALSASMAVDLVLAADTGDLRVADIDTLGRDLTLNASRGAIRSQPGSRLRADDVTLIASRAPGSAGNVIEGVIEEMLGGLTVDARGGDVCLLGSNSVGNLIDSVRVSGGDFVFDSGVIIGIRGDIVADGLVRLTSCQGAIINAVPGPVRPRITATRAELESLLQVRVQTDVDSLSAVSRAQNVIVVNAGSMRADVKAPGDVFLQTTSGDLTIGTVEAGLTAQLLADGRIVDGNGAADNVTLGAGGNLLLRAGSGIGTLANPLEIVTDAVDASTRTGDVALSERDHVLVKAAAGGDVDITARGGYLILDTIAAGGRAALTAVIGGILDANGTALNVTARELLIALCDTAGTSADFLEIAVRKLDVTAFGAFVDAQGALEVERLQSTGNSQILAQGDLKLGRLESTLGKMDLIAAGGDIVDGNGGAVNLVSGSNGLNTLTATGTIGAGNALEVSLSPGFLSVLAGAAQGGVSASIEGDIVPASSVLIVNAPGSVLFRGRVQGNGTVDQGAADRVNAGQVVAGANRAPQSQGSGDGKPQKANELIDTSAVQ